MVNGRLEMSLSAERCLRAAVPESTRSAGIQLNERVSLRRSFEFVNVVRSRAIWPDAHVPPPGCVPCDQGSPCRKGTFARGHSDLSINHEQFKAIARSR